MNLDQIKSSLRGPAVLLMAPFATNGELNEDALRATIKYVKQGGITTGQGFVICPSGTGEYISLSDDEHKRMVEIAVDAAEGEFPVVAGVGSTYHKETLRRSKNAEQAGAKCIMAPPPYYYRGLTKQSVINWYETIAGAIDIGLMVYSQPQRNLGCTMDIDTINDLSKIDSVISIKRGLGPSLQDYVDTLETFSDRFAVVDNSYGYTAGLAYMHGAASYITGFGAFWPEAESAFWSMLENQQYLEAEKLHAKQGGFWNFVDNKLGGFATSALKAGMEYIGISAGPLRPPFSELTPEEKKVLFRILSDMGLKQNRAV